MSNEDLVIKKETVYHTTEIYVKEELNTDEVNQDSNSGFSADPTETDDVKNEDLTSNVEAFCREDAIKAEPLLELDTGSDQDYDLNLPSNSVHFEEDEIDIGPSDSQSAVKDTCAVYICKGEIKQSLDEENEQEKTTKSFKDLLIERKNEIDILSGKYSTTTTANSSSSVMYKCSFCPFQCPTRAGVSKHAYIHTKKKEFTCSLCGYECRWVFELQRHITLKHGDKTKTFKCHRCDYSARYKVSLQRHLLNHDNIKAFACKVCDYRGVSKAHLRVHMNKHAKIKPYACNICSYAFSRKVYLTQHIKLHFKSKDFGGEPSFKVDRGVLKCNLCDYEGGDLCHLEKHSKNQCDYMCKQCDYKTRKRGLFLSHRLTHSERKRFQCEFCDFNSHWSHALTRHMNGKHLNYRPYKCANCSFTCTHKSGLTKHISLCFAPNQSHFKCDICGKLFLKRFILTRHKLKDHKKCEISQEEETGIENTQNDV